MPYPKDRPNPPAHVVRLSIEGVNSGVNWANVFWIRNGNGQTPTLGDLDALVDDVGNEYNSAFAEHILQGIPITAGTALYYGPTGGDLGSERPFTHLGSMGGNVLTANVSTCISWHVQARYKGGHPRTYLPAPSALALFDSRSFTAAHVSAVQNAANLFHGHINAAVHGALSDLHLGTVSFVLRNAWRTPPVFRDFSPGSAHLDNRVDTQRRRLGRDVI